MVIIIIIIAIACSTFRRSKSQSQPFHIVEQEDHHHLDGPKKGLHTWQISGFPLCATKEQR